MDQIDADDSNYSEYCYSQLYTTSTHANDEIHAIHDQLSFACSHVTSVVVTTWQRQFSTSYQW